MKNYSIKGLSLIVMMLCVLSAFSQTQLQKEQITSRYDKQKIQQLETEFSAKAVIEKQQALQMARNNNWPVIIEENGTYAELQRVTPDGTPIYYTTFNVAAARSTRADHLHSGGSLGLNLDGQNMTAHVWDGGLARASHQEYDGPGGNNRFSIGDGSSTLNYHAAHVTGTIIASGVVANAKGMAPQARAIGHDWNSDLSEATNAASSGMLISNHSYGFRSDLVPDQYFGAYIADSRDWDNLLFNAPMYLMVVAAGNDGNTNYNGQPLDGQSAYDKLTGHSTSKNNLVVANAQDANIDSNGNLVSVTINSSSSEGPTDDYRIKPDITGNGTSVYSTYESSDTAYNSITGTSMASPNVAGSCVLLQQHANNVNGNFMRAATLKGLVLHTADDAGPNGPDAVYGWGLMNAKRAATAITQNGNESRIEELTLSNGQSYQITVDSDGVNDLYASISWTDRAGTATSATNSNTAVLVNDLDIRVTQGGTTYTPWRLTGVNTNGQGDNVKDPYERVDVANASGTYTITITHKGTLVGGSQNYSLIVTGLSSTPVVCNATTPTGLTINGFGSSTASVSWDPVPGASYDLRYRQTGTSTWTTNSVAGSSASLSGLTPETQYEVQVRSKCPDNSTSSYSSSATFTTTEVQLNYCNSASTNISDEYIGRVQLNTIDNPSGGQFYTDFTNISTSLAQGQNYTITVTPTWTGTVYAEGYSVWIDYNKDGDFSDSGEQVWTQSATTATPVSGSFTIPSGTHIGTTRMRVSMKYNAIPTACETFTYGEVEDYTVNLTGGTADTEAPSDPTGLTASGTTETSTNLSWNASTDNVGVTGYDVYQGAAVIATVSGTSYTVNGLTVNTSYSFSVVAKDAAGNESGASNTVNVTTPDQTAPTAPSGLAASNVTQTTLSLNWNASSDNVGVTGYDVYEGTSNLGTVTGTSADVTGLTANTSYTFSVRARDAAGNISTASNTVNVTTLSNGGGSGCSGGITAFPYAEGFENTLGAWTQSTADDINWTVDANGTPSSNTGPSSASQGSYYIYVEASGNGTGYPNKRAIINSPCYDLSGESEASFTFKYHMYGASDMGTIDLEVSDDDGATWTSIWNQSGNKGNSWLSASIDLGAYVGGSIQLRFNRLTGSTWQADIAIDDVRLTNGGSSGSGCLGGITSYPYSEGFENTLGAWSQSSADDINWTVDANGTPSNNTGPSSAFQGSYYIYVEASGNGTGYPNKRAIINSPCYDLSSATSATFSFNYHMYGSSNMGTIDLEVSDDDGATWTSIWNQSGNKGNSWLSASVNLDAYTGGGIQLRFNRLTGSTWQADIAIDNIALTANTTNAYATTSTSSSEGSDVAFKVYPNPVKHTLNVSLLGVEAQTYQITNMVGQIVMKGVFTETINVTNLESGVYMLQLVTGEDVKSKRFIKE